MDEETKNKFDELENRISSIEEKARKNGMVLQLQIDTLLEMINNHHQLHQIQSERASDYAREMQKLREVYYYVFPDRLEPDVRFEQQLRALERKDPPDGK